MRKSKRKRIKPAHQARQSLDKLSDAELADQGEALLQAGSYREAVDVYKQLLKRNPLPDWQGRLAAAYLGRAKALAAKNMVKEATILWETRATLRDALPAMELYPELYIDWLLQSGQYGKATRAFVAQHETLQASGNQGERLEVRLAALLLADDADVEQALPATAPLRQQKALAQAALQAYCSGQSEAEVRERLRAISFRSPYRDLRQLLSALLKRESDPIEADVLLARIAVEASSPYANLATIIHTVSAGTSRVTPFSTLTHNQSDFAASLLGLDQRQQRLLKQSAGLRDQHNDKALLNFIVGNLDVLDHQQAQRAALATLIDYPQGHGLYSKHFGIPSEFEQKRLQALHAERNRATEDAEARWQQCADALAADRSDPDHALAAALILRHIVQMLERAYGNDAPFTADYLEKSLALDPDDKDSYLQLARLYKSSGNNKAYYHWAEQAVARFPQDSSVLLTAAGAATERNAFKKAAGFVETLLQIDPINRQARNLLVHAHLAHARKQIKNRRFDLAEKELTTADGLERQGARSGLVEINQGLLAFRRDDKERVAALLQAGCHHAGGGLPGRFQLWLEANRQELNPKQLMNYVETSKGEAVRGEFMALINLINANDRKREGKRLQSALNAFRSEVQNFVRQPFSQEELQAICDCFYQLPHHPLLDQFAGAALKRWPGQPLFVFYQIVGQAKGKPSYTLNNTDFRRLEQALETAKQQHNDRAAVLIAPYLDGPRMQLPSPESLLPPQEVLDMLDDLREQYHYGSARERKEVLDGFNEIFAGMPPEVRSGFFNLLMNDHFEEDNDEDFPGNDFIPFNLPLPGFDPFFPGPGSKPKNKKARKKRR